jgi:hypothetical protein
MNTSTEPSGTRETEKPVESGKDAGARPPASEQPGAPTKATRPKSPREFIQERMRELDKKES